MSVADLTRAAFQNGIAPNKWVSLCKVLLAKEYSHDAADGFGLNVCNSVLVLFPVYQGDPTLRDYLSAAVHAGILPLPTFVRTFLQAVQSPELRHPSYWSALCSTALHAHYASVQSAVGSLISLDQPPAMTLGTINDALTLTTMVGFLNIPTDKIHDLQSLVVLLISCINVSQITQVPTSQATVTYNLVSNLLMHSEQMLPSLHNALTTLDMDLRLAINSTSGNPGHSSLLAMPLASDVLDVTQPIPDSDLVMCTALLRLLVEHRGSTLSCANINYAVQLLSSYYRWTSWPLPVFYRQILLSAFTLVADCAGVGRHHRYQSRIWKSFVIGRLPSILHLLNSTLVGTNLDMAPSMNTAIQASFQFTDLLNLCNHVEVTEESISVEDNFTRPFLAQMAEYGLLDVQSWDLSSLTGEWSPMTKEAQAVGVDLKTYVTVRLSAEPGEELTALINLATIDCSSQATFYAALLTRLQTFIECFDVQSQAYFAQILMASPNALDIMAMYISLDELVDRVATGPHFDLSAVGDPQTTVSHAGTIITFIQATIVRFKLFAPAIRQYMPAFDPTSGDPPRQQKDLLPEDLPVYQAWFTTLFDKKSEGIEDNIFRSTRILVLLRIAPVLIIEAIDAYEKKIMEKEVLDNGVAYFLGPLLNWTLVGVIRALVLQMQQTGFFSQYLETLRQLVMSPSTPTPILQICAPFILRASIEKKPQKIMPIIEVLRKRASSVLGITPSPSTAGVSTAANTLQSATTPSGTQSRIAWVDLPGQAIRNALTMATSGRATFLDVPHCLLTTSPLRFLSLLWKELLRSAIMHGLSTSQRLAVFVLTAPRVRLSSAATTFGPLLPIFLQASLPRIIQDTDFQSSRELATELLVAILTSSLTAAYYLALPEDQVHGPGTLMDPAAWARSLSKHLQAKRKDSATSLAILQRLSTTTLFCAHFPMFS